MDEIQKKEYRHKFYFETPLYTKFCLDETDLAEGEELFEGIEEMLEGEVDAYNPIKKTDTTFEISSWSSGIFHGIRLKCKRYGDLLNFYVLLEEDHLTKIGQWPSLADIQFAEYGKKYDKLLNKEDLKNFKKAIGLASHGAGAGSLVYLRRIFEKLIWQTFEQHKKDLHCSEEEFMKKRMIEKVEALEDFLPEQLLEMKEIYGILSQGVHELDEDECLLYFPALKLSIELILDEIIDAKMKKDQKQNVIKTIKEIDKSLKAPKASSTTTKAAQSK